MSTRVVPAGWMPAAKIARVIVHWTAGTYTPTKLDLSHYHVLIDGKAQLVRGTPSIAANGLPKASAGYAAHTLNCNTGSIGISLCAMAGAVEAPFDPGKYPITAEQWGALVKACADLCERYQIPVSPKTLLSHAEVQTNLGIVQRGKWDIARLPFDPTIKGAKAVGDKLRAEVSGALK
jgi:N-acetyl-anhydromuramyl-L-alanine amidase AmpD